MKAELLPHPCSGRVRDVPVPDSERELKPLKISLKIWPWPHENPCLYRRFTWRRGSESNAELHCSDRFSLCFHEKNALCLQSFQALLSLFAHCSVTAPPMLFYCSTG